jgi:copper homeostasis protein
MNPGSAPILEVCSASADFALAAQVAGADRVELCDNLVEGGTTPSLGAVEVAMDRLTIPVMVMIRPRGGDFLYSATEMSVMLHDIEAVSGAGVSGVVFGVLDSDGRIDRARTAELVAASRPLSVTFHRAFDLSRDLDESLDTLLELGVDRVLTSAGGPSAVGDLPALERLVRRAGGALSVMPGGGIRPGNVRRVLAIPGVREVHIGASRVVPSRMAHRVEGVPMGRAYHPDEYALEVVDADRVSDVREAIEGASP